MDPRQTPTQTIDPKQRVVQQIMSSTNVLVTVSANPSVDQLAAAIGTTLILNKIGKHTTAIFSGKVPSTIEFLQPEKTFEKTTDSLRDFIISLDKSKADKLRYKVEDKFVKIFISPYHTSLSEKDLEFGQGEYNVDVVLALGVKKRDELDQAIVSHGRILHDAAVIGINTQPNADIGTVNLNIPEASSLCEVMVGIADMMKDEKKPLFDQQISTALLTGIVAETERFSNAKTTPQTMSMAAKLMNTGANQQLIAVELEEPKPLPLEKTLVVDKPAKADSKPSVPAVTAVKPTSPSTDGVLQVDHESKPEFNLPNLDYEGEEEQDNIEKIHIDNEGTLSRVAEMEAEKAKQGESTGTEKLSDLERAVKSPHLEAEIGDAKPGGQLGLVEPQQATENGNSSTDRVDIGAEPGSAPPIPPPLPMAAPPLPDNSNSPGSNVPL